LSRTELRTLSIRMGPAKDKRINLQASNPLMSGKFMSNKTRSGCSRTTVSIPSCPFFANMTP